LLNLGKFVSDHGKLKGDSLSSRQRQEGHWPLPMEQPLLEKERSQVTSASGEDGFFCLGFEWVTPLRRRSGMTRLYLQPDEDELGRNLLTKS